MPTPVQAFRRFLKILITYNSQNGCKITPIYLYQPQLIETFFLKKQKSGI